MKKQLHKPNYLLFFTATFCCIFVPSRETNSISNVICIPLLRYVHGIISRRVFERKALREVIKKANPKNGLAKFIPHRNVHGIITVA